MISRNSRRTRDNCPPKLGSNTVGIYSKKRRPNSRFCHGATSGFVGWVVVPFWKTQLQPVGLVPNREITPHEIWGALRAPRDLVVQGDTRHARNRKSCTDLARFEEGRPRSVWVIFSKAFTDLLTGSEAAAIRTCGRSALIGIRINCSVDGGKIWKVSRP